MLEREGGEGFPPLGPARRWARLWLADVKMHVKSRLLAGQRVLPREPQRQHATWGESLPSLPWASVSPSGQGVEEIISNSSLKCQIVLALTF